jgi:carotenoid cleavage dioxygenase-like enzyme
VCDIGREATYSVFAIPDEGETRVLCTFKAPKVSYMHSFALTENYFILQVRLSSPLLSCHVVVGRVRRVDIINYLVGFALVQAWPLYIDVKKLLWHKAVLEAMSWHGDDSAK